MESLLGTDRYFELNIVYDSCRFLLPNKYQLYFGLQLCDLFGYTELFELQDHHLLENYYTDLTDKEKLLYHYAKVSHYEKQYAYRKAFAEVLKAEQFIVSLDPESQGNTGQLHERYSALRDTPPMTVRKYTNETLRMEEIRDIYYIPLSVNGTRIKMAFDTGSSRSVISKSLAEKSGLIIYKTATEMSGATGTRSETNIGVADQVTIGNTLFEHVIFEVVEDSLLGVPDYDFSFDGIAGLNLFYPLGSITLNAEGMLRFNTKSEDHFQENMALFHFENRIALKFNHKVLPFKFDSGAWTSMCTNHFYRLLGSASKEYGAPQPREFGGIGGKSRTFNMVRLDSLELSVHNESVWLMDTWIHTAFVHQQPVSYFGLMGQDFIKQFREITLNFNPNSIEYVSRN